jgi:hypothetical protein
MMVPYLSTSSLITAMLMAMLQDSNRILAPEKRLLGFIRREKANRQMPGQHNKGRAGLLGI